MLSEAERRVVERIVEEFVKWMPDGRVPAGMLAVGQALHEVTLNEVDGGWSPGAAREVARRLTEVAPQALAAWARDISDLEGLLVDDPRVLEMCRIVKNGV